MNELIVSVEESRISMGRFGSLFQLLKLKAVESGECIPVSTLTSPMPVEEKLKFLSVDTNRRIMLQGDVDSPMFKLYTVPITPKNECPFCKKPLHLFGRMLICENSYCRGRTSARLQHLCSENGLNIPFLSRIEFSNWDTLLQREDFSSSDLSIIFRKKELRKLCEAFAINDYNIRAFVLPKIRDVKNMLKEPLFYSSVVMNPPIEKHLIYLKLLDDFSLPGVATLTLRRIISKALDPDYRKGLDIGTIPAFDFIVDIMTNQSLMFQVNLQPEDISTLWGLDDMFREELVHIQESLEEDD